jgi:uncharacterized protein
MKAIEQRAVEEYTRTLRGRYPGRVEKVVLFGSQARGDAREGSDVDLLIVTASAEPHLKNELTDLAFDMMLKYAVAIEPAIFSRAEWARNTAAPTSFAYTVEQEGREL